MTKTAEDFDREDAAEEAKRTLEELVLKALIEAGKIRPCGLNADWSYPAYHVGPSTQPNRVSGDVYVLDDEEGTFSVVRRTFDEDTLNDENLAEGLDLVAALAAAFSASERASVGA